MAPERRPAQVRRSTAGRHRRSVRAPGPGGPDAPAACLRACLGATHRQAGFTADWVSHHGRNWRRWLGRFIDRPAAFLEIGCFEGRATLWFLRHILTHPDSRIEVIDTFRGSAEHAGNPRYRLATLRRRFDANTRPWRHRIVVHEGFSHAVLRRMACRPRFDAVYVDAGHEAADVLEDAVLAFRLLRPGGRMIFDDYEWTAAPKPHQRPRAGIDAFLVAYAGLPAAARQQAGRCALVGRGYQVCVRKS